MTEQNRSETLSNEDPKPPRKSRKTLIIAASAVVAVLAAGGIGFTLVNRDEPQAKGSQVSQSTPSTEGTPLDPSQDEEAEMGDATTDDPGKKGNPQDGTPEDGIPQDGTPQDARPVTGDQNTNPGKKKTDEGSAGTGNHTAKPTTPSQQEQPGDTPADGPAGELAGQCAKSGC